MAQSESKSMYVGSGKKLPKDGFKLQLNLTQLWDYTQGEGKEFIKSFKDKSGKENKTIDLAIFPMKEENQTEYRTHSAKIDTWKPESKQQAQSSGGDMPF